MPCHYWGSEFDFIGLEKAAYDLYKLYFKLTKKSMVYKEKYGTIRYEFVYSWINTQEDFDVFNKCLKHITRKHPKYIGELVEDWVTYIDENDKWHQFFKGVLWGACQEEWT